MFKSFVEFLRGELILIFAPLRFAIVIPGCLFDISRMKNYSLGMRFVIAVFCLTFLVAASALTWIIAIFNPILELLFVLSDALLMYRNWVASLGERTDVPAQFVYFSTLPLAIAREVLIRSSETSRLEVVWVILWPVEKCVRLAFATLLLVLASIICAIGLTLFGFSRALQLRGHSKAAAV